MPRAPRIEYEDAIYHVMARGNQRRAIVFSDADRDLFVDTLAEICAQTQWRVLAFALMNNHYHLVIQTPSPNLVSGMTWFQNAFTRRINASNRLWGRLFGDRYKAVLVEDDRPAGGNRARRAKSDYLAGVIDYVHMNPARAKMISPATNPDQSVIDYRWTSLAQGYALPPSKRKPWLAVKDGLEVFGESDTVAGRRRYIARLDDWAKQEDAERLGLRELENQSLHSTLRRGWFWGSQEFRETLLRRFGTELRAKADTNRTGRSSRQMKDCGEEAALKLLAAGKKRLALKDKDIRNHRRGDWRRAAIAWVIWARTSGVSQQWIAEKLSLKSAPNVSQQILRISREPRRALPKPVREWLKEEGL
jgi:putative transposase